MKKNLLIIIVAPSGAGKSSFLERILKEEKRVVDTITYTTRSPRSGESEGNPYHFVSKEKFLELQKKDFFVESAVVHGNLYGTPIDQIEQTWRAGKAAIMDVDVQGARTIRSRFKQAIGIFILPPSLDELRRRIIARAGGNTPTDLEVRLKTAEREIKTANEFDYRFMNDEFEPSYQRFKKIIEEILDSH
ncbi:MAG: guanylate kinase [Proteobacteria bacterium SG_bin7]|nr:MAG: guanylate kinase [Proteobacteria bacterium SG_bin7]